MVQAWVNVESSIDASVDTDATADGQLKEIRAMIVFDSGPLFCCFKFMNVTGISLTFSAPIETKVDQSKNPSCTSISSQQGNLQHCKH